MDHNAVVNESIKLSRLANRLLSALDEIDDNSLSGEENSTHSRKIRVVLECFAEVDQLLLQRYADQSEPSSGSDDAVH